MPRIKRQFSEMVEEPGQDFAGEEVMVSETQSFATSERPRRKGYAAKIIIAVIVIVILVLGGWYLVSRLTGVNFLGRQIGSASNDWQAIFLANGQVYFGKIKSLNGREIALTDIYYLQVITKPLQGQQSTDQTQQQQELTLVKLGSELHGPTDEMVINREYVLLTEKLKDDSAVVKGINDYLSKLNEKK